MPGGSPFSLLSSHHSFGSLSFSIKVSDAWLAQCPRGGSGRRPPAALEKAEPRAGVGTCGRQLGSALTPGQAWRGGGCGMCERQVSPPQTVGKRCSAHLPAAAPRPPARAGNRSRLPPRPSAFPSGPPRGPGSSPRPAPAPAEPWTDLVSVGSTRLAVVDGAAS